MIELIIQSCGSNTIEKAANKAADEAVSLSRYLNNIEDDFYNDPFVRGCIKAVEESAKVRNRVKYTNECSNKRREKGDYMSVPLLPEGMG